MGFHPHEHDRLESLRSYDLLDTAPEAAYDDLTHLAAQLCKAPVALITLVDADRQWFKSAYGIAAAETPREHSFCSDVVADERMLVVSDATEEPRYRDNPLVTGPPGIRAYAGVPLVGRDGLPVGALCVIDRRPRHFSARQLDGLHLLAGQVVAQMELRRVDRAAGLAGGALLGEATNPVRLRLALDRGELRPHFQPIVELATGLTCGFESLLRWHHPAHGVLLPGLFLPAVESSSLVLPVGRHVLDRSLAALAELRSDPALPAYLGVAVNVSALQLQQPGLAESVLTCLERHAVPPTLLTLEITETASLLDTAAARRELEALREAGVLLALDDYGVGWSGLGRLLELPLTTLKLDRSLVAGCRATRAARPWPPRRSASPPASDSRSSARGSRPRSSAPASSAWARSAGRDGCSPAPCHWRRCTCTYGPSTPHRSPCPPRRQGSPGRGQSPASPAGRPRRRPCSTPCPTPPQCWTAPV